jgi:hypothetical protein
MFEITTCVQGIYIALFVCSKVVMERTCYSSVDETGSLLIGATWSLFNLSTTLKQTLFSKPH